MANQKRPATSRAAPNDNEAGASSAASKATDELTDGYVVLLAKLDEIQRDASAKQWDLLRDYVTALSDLWRDAAAADPTATFVAHVLEAFKNNDAQAVAEAQNELTRAAQQALAKSERRYRELLESSAAAVEALQKEMQSRVVEEGRAYGNRVAEAIKSIDVDELDATSKLAMAQLLLMSAMWPARSDPSA